MATFNIEPGRLHAMYVQDVEQQLWLSAIIGLIIATAASVGLALLIVRPLRSLALATQRLQHGDYRVRSEIKKGEVGLLADNFNALAMELEQEEHRRTQFMADLGHELRTPIMSLRGYTEGLEDGIFKADEAYFALMAGEFRHLTALSHTIETMQIEQSNTTEDGSTVPIVDLFESSKSRWNTRFSQRGLKLNLLVPDELKDSLLIGSPILLKQIVDNLLSNMVKYASHHSSCLIEVSRQNNLAVLSFSNYTSDVTDDCLPFLFDRFYRVTESRTRENHDHSSGLGLSVVKQLCVANGGKVTALLNGARLAINVHLPIQLR